MASSTSLPVRLVLIYKGALATQLHLKRRENIQCKHCETKKKRKKKKEEEEEVREKAGEE